MISAITGMHTKKALDLNRGQGWQTLSTKLTMYLEQKIGIKWAREEKDILVKRNKGIFSGDW